MAAEHDLAIVTGGGSGIGQAICKLFASKGIDVIVADINENGAKETIQELDKISKTTKNAAIHVDVSKIQSIENLLK